MKAVGLDTPKGNLFMKLIKLGSKKYPGLFAKVDDGDFEWLNQFKWSVCKRKNSFYAVKGIMINGKADCVLMHRYILLMQKSKKDVDHKNGDGLDNQRHNLRMATRSQNNCNRKRKNRTNPTSKYLGVYLYTSQNGKYTYWIATCRENGKKKVIVCKTEIEAASAYNKMAIKFHGEFASLNVF